MINVGHGLLVIGGKDGSLKYSSKLYRLSCYNNSCQWETLPQELKTPRELFVAVALPDNFVTCN